jgi:SAM-dependent methyltransferase
MDIWYYLVGFFTIGRPDRTATLVSMNQTSLLDDAIPGSRLVSDCEICGGTDFLDVAKGSAALCPIKMCKSCGHFFTSPCIDTEDMAQFYDEEFEGDAGAETRLAEGAIAGQKIRREQKKMRQWALPIITGQCELAGKKVLDLRTRSGSMAELMAEQGADVTGIDPFPANVDFATNDRKLDNVLLVPLSDWHRLEPLENDTYDVVSALTIHTLAHLPWPRKFLSRLYDLTKPGALLFFNEKSVLEPGYSTARSVLDIGAGHYHHFTVESFRQVFEAAGFEILNCELDSSRKSSAKHIKLIARTPDPKAENPGRDGADFYRNTDLVLQKLADAEKQQRRRRHYNIVRGKFKTLKNRFK